MQHVVHYFTNPAWYKLDNFKLTPASTMIFFLHFLRFTCS